MTRDELAKELERALPKDLIQHREVGGGRAAPYLEGHEAINQANRLFGFDGWGMDVLAIEFQERGTAKFYTATVRVMVKDCLPKTDVGVGVIGKFETGDEHDKAVKSAVTDAMKRALRQFGPQFGNALYDKEDPSRAPEPASRQTQPRGRDAVDHEAAARYTPAPSAQSAGAITGERSWDTHCMLHNAPWVAGKYPDNPYHKTADGFCSKKAAMKEAAA